MEQGLAALGIDVRSIVFQLINFAILFWILQRFAFRPLLKILKDRQEKISESLQMASEVSKSKEEAKRQQKLVVLKARQEAEKIVQQATLQSKTIIADAEAKAVSQVQKMKDAAQQEIQRDVIAAQSGLRQQAIGLVLQATKKVIGEKLVADHDEEFITKALDEAI
ncbi:MAG TPA: F0F1 ATP synthase subunit B [Candidatus Andersenbacteria bacterium]|nr:F0F1 ATP synthase subunit B [Candidatus Andersenbacteria bacterium]